MPSIRDRFLAAEDQFLIAVADGDAAIETFDRSWHALLEETRMAMHTSALDEETTYLVESVSASIDVLASSFSDLFSTSDTLHSDMGTEVEDALARLSLDSDEEEDLISPTFIHSPLAMKHENDTYGRSSIAFGYPAFLNFREPSLVSDGTSEGDDDDDLPSTPVIGKRSLDDFDQGVGRIAKRARSLSHPSDNTLASWPWDCEHDPSVLPGPQTDVCRDTRPLPHRKALGAPAGHSPARTQLKRRFSDATDLPAPKRPRGLQAEPRRHTVSNPLPGRADDLETQTHNIYDWASTFEIVEPATFAPPSTSLPMVVEVFSNWHKRDAQPSIGLADGGCVVMDPPSGMEAEELRLETPGDSVLVADSTNASALGAMTEPMASAYVALSSLDEQVGSPRDEDGASGEPRQSLSTSEHSISDATLLASHEFTPSSTSAMLPALLDATEHSASTSAVETSVEPPSRSPSPFETPPPSFERAMARVSDPDLPGCSSLDLYAPMGSSALPPPCEYSSNTKRRSTNTIGSKGNLLDVGALLAELLPFTSAGEKHGFMDAFHKYVHVPRAGFAITI
ncbi:uncharacterized protein C8Q71DRAFT_857267 [Rhodofomes roseus]|uniref:Mating-type protein A-alpha/beta 1 N-terminal domain-containing protein n=1 Tax=Rhodofomes roseus TaxID=34475 RepID=A0ABQ8KGE8_9APHY|nr:uncharacterized protein C8Q71DRAFT_857267 [Rhodofomes roseus]KAH9836930.1 hypothetical protein C8Q71DRAFT_857267 [Rhodofomes roseus]